MRVVFAGTPEFAARCLDSILRSGHVVAGVLTQPDRPAGRGLAPSLSAVKKLAVSHGIPLQQAVTLKDELLHLALRRWEPEVLVVASYGLILPKAMLEIPLHGAINIHASLLPRWRGPAPIQRAILAGDRETGVSIMRMNEGLDTGPVFRRQSIAISDEDTAGSLHDRLAALGGKLVVEVLRDLENGSLGPATPQPEAGITYAGKLDKREFHVDWRDTPNQVNRLVRALAPSPGARARIRGVELKIWRCTPVFERGEPGSVLRIEHDGVSVACGEHAVLVTELQRSGGRRLAAADFLRGFPLVAGERFDISGS